jgi:hypothetical protein
VFVEKLKDAMRSSMAACGEAIAKGKSGGVKVITRRGEARWHVPDLGKLQAPVGLRALHQEVAARWGVIDLLDFLKEADFVTSFTDAFTSIATREVTAREVVRKRLLLLLYALGTNVGIKRVADGGGHGENEAALRATRYLFVNRDNLRDAIGQLVNATLRMRDPAWWGEGTACASDAKKFGSWSSKSDDRVPHPLRRTRRDDLLACRAQIGVRLLAAEIVQRLGGLGDDRGGAAALHRRLD